MQSSRSTLLKTTLIIFISLLISINVSFSQTKIQQMDKLLNLYLEYGQFNGSVLVADQGKVIYKKGFGMANMEWDIPNNANTKHRLGSITKQFTAMIMLQLASEDKLDLHAPITTYLPDYPEENGNKITTHHLLTHSAGIPNYTSFPGFFKDDSRDPYTPEEFTKKFAEMELEFTPGDQFSYSNSGYFLLGVIAEKLTDKSYEDLLIERIFTPLGMNDSGYDNHEDILNNRATGYEKNGRSFINSRYLDMSIPYAAGSLYSTVEDLYIWDQVLYTSLLLPQEYMDMYFKPYIRGGGSGYYAYGWGIGKEVIGNSSDSLNVISHGGGINGFNTNISRAPSDKSLVVLLNNTGGAPLNQITRAIRGIMNGKTYDLPKRSVAYAVLEVIQAEGIDQGIAHFNTIKGDDNYDLSQNEMNQIGYQLMGNDQFDEAKSVFKFNVEAFPESFNAYDSYAEALMKVGEDDLAIENYKRSIKMNPANQNGIDMLKKMGIETEGLVKEVIVPTEILESYVGKYELAPSFIITVTKDGGQLKAQATGQPMFEVFPKSNNEFYLKVVDAQITFNLDQEGNVESMTLFQGGRESMGKRIVE
jgi:CubicO group peptidase (beta-lactamase class C family)